MGKKSPAKWIKTVLFGKKHSKSHLSKSSHSLTSVVMWCESSLSDMFGDFNDFDNCFILFEIKMCGCLRTVKQVSSDEKTPLEDPNAIQAVLSDPIQLTERGTDSFELDEDKSDTRCDDTALHPPNQVVDSPSNEATVQFNDPKIAMQEQAARKVQAAFRGYLARRAFRTLKGIIRLQALIRGHLVRRQAVATLRCMRAIVQFQALAHGSIVRRSDAIRHRVLVKLKPQEDPYRAGNGTNKFLASENPTTNAFIRKLLVTVPNTMPLALLYESSEPNSSWSWLDRWSLSRFWAHPSRTKKSRSKSKPQKMQSSKRTIHKVSATENGDDGALSSFETDKPKRNLRKATNDHTEAMQDQPQTELERVKHNLRKVSALASSKESEPTLSSSTPIVSEQEVAIPLSENMDDSDVVVETTANGPIEGSHEITNETHPSENGAKMESAQLLEVACKEESSSGTKGNPKIRKRKSLPAKLEHAEINTRKNSATLPSYMAATESAKAKLRTQQASPSKAGEDGKLSSLSPRMNKPPTQANGTKGSGSSSNRTNRTSTTSRDDKALQPGWRK